MERTAYGKNKYSRIAIPCRVSLQPHCNTVPPESESVSPPKNTLQPLSFFISKARHLENKTCTTRTMYVARVRTPKKGQHTSYTPMFHEYRRNTDVLTVVPVVRGVDGLRRQQSVNAKPQERQAHHDLLQVESGPHLRRSKTDIGISGVLVNTSSIYEYQVCIYIMYVVDETPRPWSRD